jgi:integrase
VGNRPVQRISRREGSPVAAGSVRYLQPGELRAVLEASSEWLRPVRALAACNGMRRSELLGLCWLDVDLAQGRVMLPQTKNGEGRIVYLNETAKAVIPPSLPTCAQRICFSKTSQVNR